LYDIHNGCSKCPPFAATQARRRLGPMPFLYLLAGWGTSSPRTRDGRSRAADTRNAGFHTSVAVAAQQSGSKSCGLYCTGRGPAARLQREDSDSDCGGVAAAHYGVQGTPRPSCHQQHSEAVA